MEGKTGHTAFITWGTFVGGASPAEVGIGTDCAPADRRGDGVEGSESNSEGWEGEGELHFQNDAGWACDGIGIVLTGLHEMKVELLVGNV